MMSFDVFRSSDRVGEKMFPFKRFGKFTTKTDTGMIAQLMLNSEKYPKKSPKMHNVLLIDDKNMIFGTFADKHSMFFYFCLFYVKIILKIPGK